MNTNLVDSLDQEGLDNLNLLHTKILTKPHYSTKIMSGKLNFQRPKTENKLFAKNLKLPGSRRPRYLKLW